MKKRKSVGTQGLSGGRLSAGIGYVFIPNDRSRSEFIRQCMNTTTISILTDNNEYLHQVAIDPWILQQIEWPDENNNSQYGSVVVWVNMPVHNKPVIISKINRRDEIAGLFENQFKLNKVLGETYVEIVGDADRGQIAMNIKGGKGKLDIALNNESESANLNLYVKGNITTQATKDITIRSSSDRVYVKGKVGQQLGEGKEPIALGQTLKDLLDEFLDEVGNITVSTSLGQMPILNKTQILALKKKTESILSKLSTTD